MSRSDFHLVDILIRRDGFMSTPFAPALRALLSLLVVVCVTGNMFAAGKRPTAVTKSSNATVVELFDGIKSGQLSVRVIPKNAFLSRVRITNTTDKPLTVKLPKAVAAVHVFKQLQQIGNGNGNGNLFGNQNNGNNNGNNSGSGQSVGGQLGNGNGNGNGQNQGLNQNLFQQGPGQGFFSIPPKRTRSIPLHSVCLQHGKKTPYMRMTYELRPLRSVVDSPGLERILADFHPQKTDRRIVQAAAWHLASRMSWKRLLAKRTRRIGLSPVRYFTVRQLRSAYQVVQAAKKEKTRKREPTTPRRITRVSRR